MNKKKQKTQTRLVWADGIRVVAIFLVVYVHQLYLLPPLTFSTLPLWTPQLFTQIGVPLFVLVSGALLIPKDESLRLFFTKRVQAVLIPWIFWICVYSALAFGVLHQTASSITDFLHIEYQIFFSRFWFLPMIFGLYILTPLIRVFAHHAKESILSYAIFIWFISIVCVPVLPAFFGKHIVPDTALHYFILQYVGLYLLGYLLVYKNHITSSLRIWVIVLLLSIMATYTATFFDSIPEYPYIDRTFFRIFSPTFLPGVIAVFMIFYLKLKNIGHMNPKLQRLLIEASKSALGIYLIHELVQLLLSEYLTSINTLFTLVTPILGIPLRAIAVFLISFGIIAFLRKIPVIRSFA